MKINLKVRLKNKTFLVALFSAILLVVKEVAATFGLDTTIINEQATVIFNSVLGLLVLLGVVMDPTTEGAKDSEQAMKYNEPKK